MFVCNFPVCNYFTHTIFCHDILRSGVTRFAPLPSRISALVKRGLPVLGETDRNTILSRRFAGGSLKIVPARAPRSLRRHTARLLFIDEADMPASPLPKVTRAN